MTAIHAIAAAASCARHASRRTLKPSSSFHRPLLVGSASASSLPSDCSMTATSSSLAAIMPTRIPMGAARLMGSTSLHTGNATNNANNASSYRMAGLAAAASLAVATSYALASPIETARCESNTTDNNNSRSSAKGLADESEDGNSTNVIVQDGMDTGSESAISPIKPNDDSIGLPGLAEADEDNGNNNGNANVDVEDEEDDDDPSKDEETTCSICLINRQGPCRKYWLKFEKCMKEHSAEKDGKKKKKESYDDDETTALSSAEDENEGREKEDGEDKGEGGGEEQPSKESMENEWDSFMVKSIQPGEDDDDEDEDDEDDDGDDDEDEEEEDTDNSASDETQQNQEPDEEDSDNETLAQRCDKFMIPWISCIQSHRNVYSLISNAFYQKDYIDPLEDTISESRRMCYRKKNEAEIGEVDGYVMKFYGVEVDLGNWREHVEADADDGNGEGDEFEEEMPVPSKAMGTTAEEPHLINASAKFSLMDPNGNGRPIEVAYIKDQKGRLLGFDSFTKRDSENGSADSDDDGSANTKEKAEPALDGECTFHIVPGETTSIAAYAIYRGESKTEGNDDGGEESGSGRGLREDYLYYTRDVPLPGVQSNQK